MKLALQLGNNDIHSAHEFLATLSRSSQYAELDRDLTELTRSKYEAIQPKIKLEEPRKKHLIEQEPKPKEEITSVEEKTAPEEAKDEKPSVPAPPSSGPPFLAGLMKATTARRSMGTLPEPKPAEDKTEEPAPISGPPFLAGLMKATAARKNIGALQEPERQQPALPTVGPPFLAGLMKATAGRRNAGSLEDNSDDQVDEKPKIPSGGPPFLAGLLKATTGRRSEGSLESVGDEMKPSKSPMNGGPPFLAGLMKATAGRKNQGELSVDGPIAEPSAKDPSPPQLSSALAPMNPNPPPAPPLPDYLRYPRPTSLQSSPSSLMASGNIELSIADDLSRTSTPPPFPGFGGGPPPPPPFPGAKVPSIPETRHKIKNTLHWGEIRNADRIRNTIWSELQATGDTSEKMMDVHKFEELFCVNPNDETSKSVKKSEPVEEVKYHVILCYVLLPF